MSDNGRDFQHEPQVPGLVAGPGTAGADVSSDASDGPAFQDKGLHGRV